MRLVDLLPPEGAIADEDAVYEADHDLGRAARSDADPAQDEAILECVSGANVVLADPHRIGQEPGRDRRDGGRPGPR